MKKPVDRNRTDAATHAEPPPCFACEDGWDYTVTDERFHELDGGQLDNPELSLQEARNEILSDLGWDKRSMVKLGYEFVRDKADAVAEAEMKEVRKSALEQLAGIASISGGGATKHKEAVR